MANATHERFSRVDCCASVSEEIVRSVLFFPTLKLAIRTEAHPMQMARSRSTRRRQSASGRAYSMCSRSVSWPHAGGSSTGPLGIDAFFRPCRLCSADLSGKGPSASFSLPTNEHFGFICTTLNITSIQTSGERTRLGHGARTCRRRGQLAQQLRGDLHEARIVASVIAVLRVLSERDGHVFAVRQPRRRPVRVEAAGLLERRLPRTLRTYGLRRAGRQRRGVRGGRGRGPRGHGGGRRRAHVALFRLADRAREAAEQVGEREPAAAPTRLVRRRHRREH